MNHTPARLLLLTCGCLPLLAQSPFQTTRHAGLPAILYGDKFASGDLDGDGDVDLFVANDNNANQLLLNDGAGKFVDATAGRFVMQPGPNATHSVDLADIDGDGDLDILIGNDDSLSNRVYVNDGFGFFTDVTATALPPNLEFTTAQVVADFDGDGDVDWFTVENGPCHFYLNNGAGVFSDASATRLAGLPQLAANRYDVTPSATDIDGDGDLDVMIQAVNGVPYLIRNQGGVLSPFPTQLPANIMGFGHWFADYDGDGDADIFAAGGSKLLQNQGNGTFVDVTAAALGSQPPAQAFACFDIDNDGDPDLLTTAAIWWNNGNGTFTAQLAATAWIGGYNEGVASADFDGDGDIDLPGKPNFLRQTATAAAPVRGAAYSLACHGRPGQTSLVGVCGALGSGALAVGPFGVLQLDPATVLPLAFGSVNGAPLVITWQVPNLPGLAGTALHYQALVVDPLEGPVVTNWIRDVVQ